MDFRQHIQEKTRLTRSDIFKPPPVENYPYDSAIFLTFKVKHRTQRRFTTEKTAIFFIERLNRSLFGKNHRKHNRSLQNITVIEESLAAHSSHVHCVIIPPNDMPLQIFERRIREVFDQLKGVVKSRDGKEPNIQHIQSHFDFQNVYNYCFKHYPIFSECADFSLKKS